MIPVALRSFASIAGVGAITFLAARAIPVNATTAGFAYLLFVLIVASVWGFIEAAVASVAATLTFNFFFLPPVGTFTIADPQNWVALFSFLATALVASQLSGTVKRQAKEAIERQKDVERLYTFSRSILLLDQMSPVPKQLAHKLAETFGLTAVVLYDRRADEFFRAGPSDFDGMDDQLRESALNGTTFSDTHRNRVITAVRLGSQPIASLALQGAHMQDSALQGVANLVAIGLERARAQELAHQVEAGRQSEQLRTTLIDAMAHELKTPLTSIRAATSALLSNPSPPEETRTELLKVADEEAEHLKDLIDNAVEMARLDLAQIDVQREPSNLARVVHEVLKAMHAEIDGRPIRVVEPDALPSVALDQRLVKLALKQLIDNALKYSPPGTPVTIALGSSDHRASIAVTNQGDTIPVTEQSRIFDRFYRSPSVQQRIPGSGLGLSISHRIARAHGGDLTVSSGDGRTTFQMTLPLEVAVSEAAAKGNPA